MATEEQIEGLRVAVQETERLHIINLCGSSNGNETAHLATIKPGKKYLKLDVGRSGKYMIEVATDRVYGIKAYGVIHRGHYYGTVSEFTRTLIDTNQPCLLAAIGRREHANIR